MFQHTLRKIDSLHTSKKIRKSPSKSKAMVTLWVGPHKHFNVKNSRGTAGKRTGSKKLNIVDNACICLYFMLCFA